VKKILLYLCLVLSFNHVDAQQKSARISGMVSNVDGEPIPGATLYLKRTIYKTEASMSGAYSFTLPSGKYEMLCSALGYEAKTVQVILADKEHKKLSFSLSTDSRMALKEVEVQGKSGIKEVKESPYNVVALDAKSRYNSTLDLGHLLDKASGVKMRETGGVGSSMAFSINGFTGKHIKLFMDGVPMDGFGTAFQLNNIPVNIADRIEVYKGVVPIEFGADAMGGVINIVTNQRSNSYIDASYSYGSFNTHKSNISLGHTAKSGFTFQLNAFQNYSDNSYKVRTNILDINTGNFSNDEHWVKRFHDNYHNETIMAKVGVVNKAWADRLLLGITLGQEQADIQHANLMKIVYGMRERSGTTVLPSLSYEKKNLFVKNLSLQLNANYNINNNENIDTAARQYNWLGEYRKTASKGEASYGFGKYRNENGSVTTNLRYRINEYHSFMVNDVITGYKRKNTDRLALIDQISAADTIERSNVKNVLGAAYQFNYQQKWVTSLFGKYYSQQVAGPVDTASTAGGSSYAKRTERFNTTGYGVATTYFLTSDLQLKASWEKAYRLPTDNELFGDEVLETGNSSLRAENSYNYNLGATLNRQVNEDHSLYVDVAVYYRDIKDYIQRLVDQRYGTAGYSNHGKVRNLGVDAEIHYYYKDLFSIGGNFTYQDMRNKEKYTQANSTQLSTVYNDRMRNVPYLFGNADAAFFLRNIGGKEDVLSFGYTLNYIGRFFLNWESQGNQQTKADLPKQISHDFNMSYQMKNGRYNIAFEARNFTNTMLFDNFSLQKPGRSFALKLRYFLVKRN